VVPHAPGAVGAEVGEVLAHLRRVDAGQGGEALGRDGADVLVGGLEQGPVVEGQAGDRRLGDSSGGGHCVCFPALSYLGAVASSGSAAAVGKAAASATAARAVPGASVEDTSRLCNCSQSLPSSGAARLRGGARAGGLSPRTTAG